MTGSPVLLQDLSDCRDKSLAGGKAVNLGDLIRAGFPVPSGFVITTEAYRQARSNGAPQLPDALADEIKKSWRSMGACPVAVRSSATAEDMADASMAGQYDTFLDIDSEKKLLDAVQCCWASLDSPRTRTYLTQHGINLAAVAMAVVVQKLVPADVAGVLFSANPQTGSREEMLIEASWGLGESVVSGRVQPDVLRIEESSGKVLAATISDKQVWLKPGEEDEKPVEEDRRKVPCLRSADVANLWELGRRAAQHFGRPQDIEWAIHNGNLFLLQSRPITTLEDAEAYEQLLSSTRARLRELFSQNRGPFVLHNIAETLKHPTPLTWSVISHFMSGRGGFGRMYKALGFEPSPRVATDGFLQRIGGQPYMDLSLAADMFFPDYPFKYDLDEIKNNPDAAQSPPTVPTGSLKARIKIGRRAAAVTERLHDIANDLESELSNQLIPQFVDYCRSEKQKNLQSLDTQQLIDLWHSRHKRLLDEFAPWSLLPSMICSMALADLKTFLQEHFWNEDPEQLASSLAASAKADTTILASAHLHQIARGTNKRAIESWLADYGHRAPDEFDLATPRWRERPDDLKPMADRLKDAADPLDLHQQHFDRSNDKLDELKKNLSRDDAITLDRQVTLLRRYLPFREDGKHYLMLGYDLLRDVILEAARRLDIGGNAFQLTIEELFDALRVGVAPQHLIAQRKTLYAAESKLSLPPIIDEAAIEHLGQPPRLSSADSHAAFPVSAGHATGPARIVHSPETAGDLGKGYILICPSTDPNWTPLFVNAAGLILERGGTLSHGAVVAREMNIPAVVLANATQLFKDSEEVTLDGRSGIVARATPNVPLAACPPVSSAGDDTRISHNQIPPPPGPKERHSNRLRNIWGLIWLLILLLIFLEPSGKLQQISLVILDFFLWPLIRNFGPQITVVIVAASMAAITMLTQRFLTDNTRLRIAKQRANALLKEAKSLPKDSPREKRLTCLAAPVQGRIIAAAFVPLALLLGPMVMVFPWFLARVEAAAWNPPPGSSFTVVATVHSDVRTPVTIDVEPPLSLDDPTSQSKTIPPIRETLERMLAKWEQSTDSNLPWDKLSREQALSDLRGYLNEGVPPQSVSWKINSDPSQSGRFPIRLGIPGSPHQVSHVYVYVSLGNAQPPSPLEAAGHDPRGLVNIKVVHPRSDQKQFFWQPFAYFGNQWDAGWLWLYLIVYIPVMFALKWLLRIP